MVEVSEDIFYQVKKQILDKLDVILQKVNLQIINYIKPQEEEFSFIELSSFEQELTHLFHYLDRLYNSLNTSVSFSSIQSYRSTVQNYQAQNQRLVMENEKLKQIVHHFKVQKLPANDSANSIKTAQLTISSSKIEQFKRDLLQMGTQLKSFARDIRKQLKNFKFDMLESRVQIIAKLKDYQRCELGSSKLASEKQAHCHLVNCDRAEAHTNQDGQDIISAINQILSIC